jgi:hypothetical protein
MKHDLVEFKQQTDERFQFMTEKILILHKNVVLKLTAKFNVLTNDCNNY